MAVLRSLFAALACSRVISCTANASTSIRSSKLQNSAADRTLWTEGFDISTNYYEKVPDTGVIREYWFNVENTTAAPDGVEVPVQLVNGSFPGPTIIADWGDTVGQLEPIH